MQNKETIIEYIRQGSYRLLSNIDFHDALQLIYEDYARFI